MVRMRKNDAKPQRHSAANVFPLLEFFFACYPRESMSPSSNEAIVSESAVRLQLQDALKRNNDAHKEERRINISAWNVFRPPPSCLLARFDYSQMELRLAAHLSGQPSFQSVFICCEVDPFSSMLKILQARKTERRCALTRTAVKRAVYAWLYTIGKGPAHSIVSEVLPGAYHFKSRVKKMLEETGGITTLGGLFRKVTNMRQALNAYCQGSAAEVFKHALAKTYELLTQRFQTSQIVSMIHDEIVVAIPRDERCKEVLSAVAQVMQNAGRHFHLKVPLAVKTTTSS